MAKRCSCWFCQSVGLSQTVRFTFGLYTDKLVVMPYVNCKICSSEFYAKPRHLKIGWGKFCSKKCQFQGQRNGTLIGCALCGKLIYRTPKNFRHSKSNSFFCDKSCFATWKNQNLIVGARHANWKHGENAYRNIMKRSRRTQVCSRCEIEDSRVLIVHHIDRNRKNNDLSNLMWLCHNCHFLEHHPTAAG